MALLDDEPRSATIEATKDARLLRIPSDRFERLLTAEPAVAKALLRTLDQRIRTAQTGRSPAARTEEPPRRVSRVSSVSLLGIPNLQQVISTISLLRQMELFKDLPVETLSRLAGIVREVSYRAGEILFEQGDVGDALYLIQSGAVEISIDGRIVAHLGKNACLGEMALVSGLCRSASAAVVEDTRLLRLWAEDFHQLLTTEPDVALAVIKTLAVRLRAVSRS